MSPEKQKQLQHHIQGILHSNALAHRHAAEVAEHLGLLHCYIDKHNGKTSGGGLPTDHEQVYQGGTEEA